MFSSDAGASFDSENVCEMEPVLMYKSSVILRRSTSAPMHLLQPKAVYSRFRLMQWFPVAPGESRRALDKSVMIQTANKPVFVLLETSC